MTKDEFDRLYEQHLGEVEAVQVEQAALLRCLIRHHGLTGVFVEGCVDGEPERFAEKVEVLRSVDGELAKLTEQAAKLPKERQAKLQPGIDDIAASRRLDMLQLGAMGEVLLVGDRAQILPVEDVALLRRARPTMEDGKTVKFDQKAIEVREDEMVRRMLRRPVAVVVLGGSHDLADNIRRQGVDCEYVRLTLDRYRKAKE